ncbi:MAG: AAA family ATPase [Candidatus Contendobacter sp.]|nr:AAA family ATPase [Candidatus Contendobacter sp.]
MNANARVRGKKDSGLALPAEHELIGSLIGRPEKLAEVDFLAREDFLEGLNWDIYQTIQRLRAAGEEVNLLTIGEALDFNAEQYGYLAVLVKDFGIYSDNFRYRAVVMRKYATARACQAAAKAGDWQRIVQLQQAYERLTHTTPKTLTARELLAMEFPPLRWLVEGVLPEGVSLLVSPPKVGKTRLATQLAIAVASGGYALNHPDTTCRPTEVLYLILESGNRRAQKDLKQLGGDAPHMVDRLHVAADWRRLSAGGSTDLEQWLDAHPAVKLVVIDTLAAVRNAGHGGSGFLYSEDYLVGSTVKGIADRRGVSVVMIHHSRKADAEDVLDTVSGSTGVTGSVDHILVIKRQRLEEDGTLTLISRDFEDRELALRYQSGLWTYLGPADEVSRHDPDWKGDGQSDARREILARLREKPSTPVELAQELGKNRSSVRYLLMKLAEEGMVAKKHDDRYMVVAPVGVEPVGAVGAVWDTNTQPKFSSKPLYLQADEFRNQQVDLYSGMQKMPPNTPNRPNTPNTPNTPNSHHDQPDAVGTLAPGATWNSAAGRWEENP